MKKTVLLALVFTSINIIAMNDTSPENLAEPIARPISPHTQQEIGINQSLFKINFEKKRYDRCKQYLATLIAVTGTEEIPVQLLSEAIDTENNELFALVLSPSLSHGTKQNAFIRAVEKKRGAMILKLMDAGATLGDEQMEDYGDKIADIVCDRPAPDEESWTYKWVESLETKASKFFGLGTE